MTDRNLIDITFDLGINHEISKASKKDLESSRSEFFDIATKTLEEGSLAKRNITINDNCGESVDLYIEKWYPGWRMVKSKPIDDGFLVQIEEDPSLKKFVFINPSDGRVYQRNAIQGNPYLDDDKIKQRDPDLWERISNPIPYQNIDQLIEFCEFADIPYEIMMGWVETKQASYDWPRSLVDMDEMSDDDFNEIQKYLVPGSISLRLEPPRIAKSEDLESDE